MVFDAARPDVWSSKYNRNGVPHKVVEYQGRCPFSEHICDQISQWANHIVTHNHTLPQDYYSTTKLLRNLDLPIEKIDVCKNDCMLYKKDNIDLDYWKFCGEARYKSIREQNPNHKKTLYNILRYLPVTPSLQRLYALEATAEQITWHANNRTEERSKCHPSDSNASRYFDRTYPHFAVELRNVRLGLCTDGLAMHGQYDGTYSC
ncbi:UNVERIFIED_CONTAM: hypothetical protein Sindi_2949100 [Sesamum indicum]